MEAITLRVGELAGVDVDALRFVFPVVMQGSIAAGAELRIETEEAVCLCEPWRVPLARWLGRGLHPWLGEVTRHDMGVSIRAGFRRGELAGLLGLGAGWAWRERTDLRGAIRLVARRAA